MSQAHLRGTLTYPTGDKFAAACDALRDVYVVPLAAWVFDGLTLSVDSAFTLNEPTRGRHAWRPGDWAGPLRRVAKPACAGALDVEFRDPAESDVRIYPGGHPAFLQPGRPGATFLGRDTGRPSTFRCVALSPGGSLCALAGGDHYANRSYLLEGSAVLLLEASTGVERGRLHGHLGPVLALAYSPDGAALAVGGYEQSLRLYDPTTGRTLASRKPAPHLYEPSTERGGRVLASRVADLCFTPDGLLVTAGGTRIALWRPDRLRLLHTLEHHEDQIVGVALSADGRWLCSLGAPSFGRGLVPFHDTGSAALWDLPCRRPLGQLTGLFTDAAFAPDGSALALLEGFDGPEDPFEHFHTIRIPAASALFRKRLTLLDVPGLQPRWSVEAEGNPQRLCFTADGHTLYTAGTEGPALVLRGWSVTDGKLTLTRPHPDPLAKDVVFTMPADLHDYTGRSWRLSGRECTGLVRAGSVLAAVTPDGVRLFHAPEGPKNEGLTRKA
jgi:WD40 repeat protein